MLTFSSVYKQSQNKNNLNIQKKREEKSTTKVQVETLSATFISAPAEMRAASDSVWPFLAAL